MVKKEKPWIEIALVGMFVLTILFYFMTLINSSGNFASVFISIGVNLAFYFIIVWFCKKWKSIFLQPLDLIRADLDSFKDFIEKSREEDYDVALEYIRENYEECFKTEYVRECFEKYLSELERLDVNSAEEFYSCDISDFINFEAISIHVKKNTADSIASAMTGLGILGTFVGLAIGLQSFDASDASAMAESIVPLIDGIKTAFYTSIYGVVISLILNYILKNRLNELEVSLNGFYDCYYNNILAYPEYIYDKQSLDIQNEQKEIMASFSESIAVSLSREMKAVVSPVFEKITDSFENFSNKVAENQVEGLDEIVNNFVTKMNSSLGNQFEALSQTIKEVCEWQKEAVKSMDAVIGNIVEEADKINNINEGLSSTIDKFDGYLDKLTIQEDYMVQRMQAYKNAVDTTFESLNGLCEKIENVVEEENNLKEIKLQTSEMLRENAEHFVEIQEKVMENSQLVLDSQEVVKTSLESFTEGVEGSITRLVEETKDKFSNIRDIFENIDAQIGESANNLSDIYSKLQNDVDSSLDRTFTVFDNELAKMAQYFDGALTGINENAEKLPIIMSESSLLLKNQNDSYIEVIEELSKEIRDAVNNVAEANSLIKPILEEINANLLEINEKPASLDDKKVGED